MVGGDPSQRAGQIDLSGNADLITGTVKVSTQDASSQYAKLSSKITGVEQAVQQLHGDVVFFFKMVLDGKSRSGNTTRFQMHQKKHPEVGRCDHNSPEAVGREESFRSPTSSCGSLKMEVFDYFDAGSFDGVMTPPGDLHAAIGGQETGEKEESAEQDLSGVPLTPQEDAANVGPSQGNTHKTQKKPTSQFTA